MREYKGGRRKGSKLVGELGALKHTLTETDAQKFVDAIDELETSDIDVIRILRKTLTRWLHNPGEREVASARVRYDSEPMPFNEESTLECRELVRAALAKKWGEGVCKWGSGRAEDYGRTFKTGISDGLMYHYIHGAAHLSGELRPFNPEFLGFAPDTSALSPIDLAFMRAAAGREDVKSQVRELPPLDPDFVARLQTAVCSRGNKRQNGTDMLEYTTVVYDQN